MLWTMAMFWTMRRSGFWIEHSTTMNTAGSFTTPWFVRIYGATVSTLGHRSPDDRPHE